MKHFLSLGLLLCCCAVSCGSDHATAAATTPTPCQGIAGAPSELAFYTLAQGSNLNGQPLTGIFSLSNLGSLCLPNTIGGCAFIENVRWQPAGGNIILGFGYDMAPDISMELTFDVGLNTEPTVSLFTGTHEGSLPTSFTLTDPNGMRITIVGSPAQ